MERASSILKSYPAHSKGGRSTNALLGTTNSDIQEKHLRRVTGYLRSLFEIRRWEKVCILLTGRSRWLGEWWGETKCRYCWDKKSIFHFSIKKKTFFSLLSRDCLVGDHSFLCAVQTYKSSHFLAGSPSIYFTFLHPIFQLSTLDSSTQKMVCFFLEILRLSCPLPRRTPSERDDMKTMWRLYDNIVEPSQAKNYISMNSIWGKSPSWE